MKEFCKDIRFFWTNKFYAAVVSLAAVCSYGFKVSHEAIGIDDTCIPLYFEEGLAPAVGRWTLYVINKIFHISDFAPWVTEAAGVLLMLLAATVWCVVFSRILGRERTMAGYTLFAALFISCPLISEIYVYYLHNGISLAYGLTGISLLFLLKALGTGADKKRRLMHTVTASAFLAVALGCYESFMIVFAVGMVFLFLLLRSFGREEKKYAEAPWAWAAALFIVAVCAIVFRWLVLRLVLGIFRIEIPESFLVEYRSVFSFTEMSMAEFFMIFKRFWVKYYLNGFAYFPITVLVLGIAAILIICLVIGIRKKDIFLPIAALGVPVLPLCMVVIEGKETYYRAAQYVPLVGAFAFFFTLVLVKECLPRFCTTVCVALAVVLLWNQCAEMNKWFYVDYLKYQDARNVMLQVAYELEKGYDTGKPIVFRGAYLVPFWIAEDAYLEYGSAEYNRLRSVGDLIDPHLIEKYNADDGNGYVFAETPVNSTLRWGVTAFDGTASELGNFWRMLGYSFRIETDLRKIEEAEKISEEMPEFPQTGYIKECGDYIIVNL